MVEKMPDSDRGGLPPGVVEFEAAQVLLGRVVEPQLAILRIPVANSSLVTEPT